jgi:hypothetical protein
MNPQRYYPAQYYSPSPAVYTPAQYAALQVQDLLAIAIPIAVMIALGAWVISVVKDLFTGEEVKFPL